MVTICHFQGFPSLGKASAHYAESSTRLKALMSLINITGLHWSITHVPRCPLPWQSQNI
jgi:hypothetical protein